MMIVTTMAEAQLSILASGTLVAGEMITDGLGDMEVMDGTEAIRDMVVGTEVIMVMGVGAEAMDIGNHTR
jgi:hypothetical protein